MERGAGPSSLSGPASSRTAIAPGFHRLDFRMTGALDVRASAPGWKPGGTGWKPRGPQGITTKLEATRSLGDCFWRLWDRIA